VLVLLAEHLNSFCAQHWESFATQNYFDTHGSFAAVIYASPLLFIALLQMVCDMLHINCGGGGDGLLVYFIMICCI
jgi:hypothetical protein